jgi:hypothetical protein
VRSDRVVVSAPCWTILRHMQVPRIMRRINRAFTNPAMRTIAGRVPPLAIVQQLGRRSGQSYRTPVLAFATDEGYVSPLPYGTDTDWCLNVLEAGSCTLEVLGRKIRVSNLGGGQLHSGGAWAKDPGQQSTDREPGSRPPVAPSAAASEPPAREPARLPAA